MRPREASTDGAAPTRAGSGMAGRARSAVVEVMRLAVVLAALGVGHVASGPLAARSDLDGDTVQIVATVLGALLGYVGGGVVARLLVDGVDRAQRSMQEVPSVVLVAGAIGATIGLLLGVVVAVPLLLAPARAVTMPLAALALVASTYAGARTGAARGGDFGRWVGARGRLSVTNPSRGDGAKLLDTSALMDARLVDVARRGFLDGTLVVPMFVLEELQSLADGGDRRRADLARRGLDALQTLQHEALVAVEVTDDEVPGVREVDAKLAALCRRRSCALVTVDGNLERVAEIAGIRVLNLHGLADALRPTVQPGDEVALELVRHGQQAGQAVGYLDDGTMVVVEDAGEQVGTEVDVVVTSVTQTRRGRMLFAVTADPPAARVDGAADAPVDDGPAGRVAA